MIQKRRAVNEILLGLPRAIARRPVATELRDAFAGALGGDEADSEVLLLSRSLSRSLSLSVVGRFRRLRRSAPLPSRGHHSAATAAEATVRSLRTRLDVGTWL